jgi:hypothetical protein
MATNFINNYIKQLLAEDDSAEEGDAPIHPADQAAKARHPGTPEESVVQMRSHTKNLSDAIAAYKQDRTAFHAVHGKDHPGANELHDFMKHILKASGEDIDQPLSLPPDEIDRFRSDDEKNPYYKAEIERYFGEK